jgi:transposase-like protein
VGQDGPMSLWEAAVAHRNAKLTPLGRQLLVQRIVDLGWPVSQAASSVGVSRPTAYKWLTRWTRHGLADLEDHASRPQVSPRATPPAQVDEIRALRLVGGCSHREAQTGDVGHGRYPDSGRPAGP